MKTFENVLSDLLIELQIYSGSVPTLKIDYRNKKLLLTEANSGFIKQLVNSKVKYLLHLSTDGLSVEAFKD